MRKFPMAALLPLVLVLACGEKDGDTEDTGEVAADIDADGDGSIEGVDCDAADAANFPGNAESCDGADNDCDGVADNGVLSTFYVDADGDGYGDFEQPVEGCEAAEGQVVDSSDCDDEDSEINPGATEVCDEVDNDCDARVDDEDDDFDSSTGLQVWPDADGDGHGDRTSEFAWACAVEEGFSSLHDDCDDAVAEVNPDEDELCDGRDTDCDGEVDEDSAADAPTWYADTDEDGYGDPADALVTCYEPSGYVDDNSDCEPQDEASYPGATETCDEVDNDCDGTVDPDDELIGEEEACAATSCLDVLTTRTGSPSDGSYWIDADGDGTGTEVYCDMSTDGGGYTFLKVDYGSTAYAPDAETYCANLGMQLFIPRTEDHKDVAIDLANDSSIGPGADISYMRILGIYPVSKGNKCKNVAFNSGSCTGWGASDGGPYWVGTDTSITEPNGDNDTTASMYYTWSGYDISWYNDVVSPGYGSQYFMCDTADMTGP